MKTYDTAEEQKAKEKRLAELETLIPEATRMMETAKALGVDTPEEMAKRRKERALLMQEKLWYERGHAYADWNTFLAEQEAREAKTAADARKKAKTEATKKAEAEKLAAEQDAKLRAEFEAERDEFTAWKRAKAARTF